MQCSLMEHMRRTCFFAQLFARAHGGDGRTVWVMEEREFYTFFGLARWTEEKRMRKMRAEQRERFDCVVRWRTKAANSCGVCSVCSHRPIRIGAPYFFYIVYGALSRFVVFNLYSMFVRDARISFSVPTLPHLPPLNLVRISEYRAPLTGPNYLHRFERETKNE